MKILSNFDSGSVEVIDTSDLDNIQLAISPDNKQATTQWFHFRCVTQAGQKHTIRLINAGQSTFSKGWEGYRVMASYDEENWFRIDTTYENGQLIISHTPEKSVMSYAYFKPYSLDRQNKFNLLVSGNQNCLHKVVAKTFHNNSVDLLTIGSPGEGKKSVWLIARQHPGETMAQWFAEGFVRSLLGRSLEARRLREAAVFYVVPNMNPDGSMIGNHRTNAHGLNLNREWSNPSKELCPEVYFVKQEMEKQGVDLLLDIHGEEEIPYTFLMAAEGPGKVDAEAGEFKSEFERVAKDFQTKFDYNTYHADKRCSRTGCGNEEETFAQVPSSPCSTKRSCCNSNLEEVKPMLATEYAVKTFGCLAMVLEMPFIDHFGNRDKDNGWTAARSQNLALKILTPLLQHLDNQDSSYATGHEPQKLLNCC